VFQGESVLPPGWKPDFAFSYSAADFGTKLLINPLTPNLGGILDLGDTPNSPGRREISCTSFLPVMLNAVKHLVKILQPHSYFRMTTLLHRISRSSTALVVIPAEAGIQ
jgi:hypothetical protein